MSADVWHAEDAMSQSRWLAPLRPFAQRRTWAELGYALVGLPIGVVGFVFTVVTLALSVGLAITFIGLPLLAVSGVLARRFGSGVRRLANSALHAGVAAPPPRHVAPGLFGWLSSCLTDGAAWRARAYLVLKLPIAVVGFVVTAAFYVYGLGGLTYWIWRPFLPCNTSSDHVCHHGIGIAADFYVDTAPRIIAFTVVCAAILLAAPWVVRAVLFPDRLLVGALLGPTRRSVRVAELERTRAVAVDDSAATLRRIERDLHDGTQARLVAVAMNVGLAREKLAEGSDPADAARLLDAAHATAKDAIVELRDLARGIHPPVLDAGIDTALATLAAHCAVPVTVMSDITDRPDPAIETMVYFCAAELITNIAKHSGARHATIQMHSIGGWLQLTVSDDGRGGAVVGAGTGLAGLTERVATVDGRLTVDSPAGGPTLVHVDVPLHVSATR